MKKVLLAFDGSHFAEAAFEFACRLNEVAPIFLTGVFLPRVDLSASWSYAPGGGTAFIPTLEKNTAEQIERNIKTFELECCLKNIKHRVHKYPYDGALSELGKETRFTDLLILDSSTFFNETGQEFSNKRTILLHLTSEKNAVIPDLSFIEELVARHFTDLTIQALKAMPGKHFETWLGTIRAPMLVCGSFARQNCPSCSEKALPTIY